MHRNHDLSVSQTTRLIARCPTKTDLEFTFLERFYAFTQYSYNTSTTTYLKSVGQQLQEILTQLTTFAALIVPSTTNQAQCLHT